MRNCEDCVSRTKCSLFGVDDKESECPNYTAIVEEKEEYNIEISRIWTNRIPKDFYKEATGESSEPFDVLGIDWSANVGFGQCTFCFYEDGRIEVDSECMSKEFVKALLDKVVENAEIK